MPLTQDSGRLIEALKAETGFPAWTENTGGGCMVAAVALDSDEFSGGGRQVWLTREDRWILGFYDFADAEDEGVATELMLYGDAQEDPAEVAKAVGGILKRLRIERAA